MEHSGLKMIPHEFYRPRAVIQVGIWQVEHTSYKIYGILADGKNLTSEMIQDADLFVRGELPVYIEREGGDHGLGFVIVHPGDLGVSIVAHWWAHGSVLCQRIRRKLYGADKPMDTVTRPVIACVWELGLINAEQQIWRETMMKEQPEPIAYLNARVAAAQI